MRIVITGASGNVGTALLRALRNSGQSHDLVGVVRRPPQAPAEGLYSEADWYRLDLAGDGAADQLRDVFAGADAVVHLAWGFQPTRNTEYLTRLGVGGTTAVV